MVEFAGWVLPVQYESIVAEHNTVRSKVGLFDISHMGRLAIHGPNAVDWLHRVVTNDVLKIAPGQQQYNLITNENFGIVDDVIVSREADSGYAVVCNASNREKVIAHFHRYRPEGLDATLTDRTFDTAMIAAQGPRALAVIGPLFDQPLADLGYYRCVKGRLAGVEAELSRTGYTGEDGFEAIVAAGHAEEVWSALMTAGAGEGIRPCGLGARDTLRLEAGMPLYGHELSEAITPIEAGLGRYVHMEMSNFVGRDVFARMEGPPAHRRVGLVLAGKRIAREGALVLNEGQTVGVVTSGTFGPTLQKSLAMARVNAALAAPGTKLVVDLRGTPEPAEVVPLPFYRRSRVQ
jgi:aminomethyltransferase